MQRVIRANLDFFDGLRASGGSWAQIAVLLRGEGLRSRTGDPVDAGVLRALYSRALKEMASHPDRTQRPRAAHSASDLVPAERRASGPKRDLPGSGSLAERLERAARLRGHMDGED